MRQSRVNWPKLEAPPHAPPVHLIQPFRQCYIDKTPQNPTRRRYNAVHATTKRTNTRMMAYESLLQAAHLLHGGIQQSIAWNPGSKATKPSKVNFPFKFGASRDQRGPQERPKDPR